MKWGLGVKSLKSSKSQAGRLLGLAFAIVIIIALVMLVLSEFRFALAFLSGGFAMFCGGFLQVHRVFKERHPSAAKRIVWRFYQTEVMKFVFVAVMFLVLMHITNLDVLAYVLGVLVMELGIWLCLPFCWR